MERQGRLRRRWIFKPTGTGADAQGVMLFWDETLQAYVSTETTELVFDDDSSPKRLGINKAVPTSELDVGGTVTMTRLLAGGVVEP